MSSKFRTECKSKKGYNITAKWERPCGKFTWSSRLRRGIIKHMDYYNKLSCQQGFAHLTPCAEHDLIAA